MLAKLVRLADAREEVIDYIQCLENDQDGASEKITALAEMICRAGNACNKICRVGGPHGGA